MLPNIVKNAERPDVAAGVFQDIQRMHEAYVQCIADLQTEFLEVDRNYEVTAYDHEPLISQFESLQSEHKRGLPRLRDGLKGHLTREE